VTREACAAKFVVVRDIMDEGVAAGGAFLSLCARLDHPGRPSLYTLLESYYKASFDAIIRILVSMR
jgi:hypothetical protein